MAIPEIPINSEIVVPDRLCDAFERIFLALDTITLAVFVVTGEENPLGAGPAISMTSEHVPQIRVPYPDNLIRALTGTWPQRPRFGFSDIDRGREDHELSELKGINFQRSAALVEDAANAQFVLYYEQYIDVVKRDASHDRDRFIEPWKFARVIRNAIVHSGTIDIRDPTFPPVSWRGLQYGPADDGKRAIGTDIQAPEIIYLMLQMDEALSHLI